MLHCLLLLSWDLRVRVRVRVGVKVSKRYDRVRKYKKGRVRVGIRVR